MDWFPSRKTEKKSFIIIKLDLFFLRNRKKHGERQIFSLVINKGIKSLPQTNIFESLFNRIHSLKYQSSTSLDCKDIGIRKS